MRDEEFILYSRLVQNSDPSLSLKLAALNGVISAEEYELLKEAGIMDRISKGVGSAVSALKNIGARRMPAATSTLSGPTAMTGTMAPSIPSVTLSRATPSGPTAMSAAMSPANARAATRAIPGLPGARPVAAPPPPPRPAPPPPASSPTPSTQPAPGAASPAAQPAARQVAQPAATAPKPAATPAPANATVFSETYPNLKVFNPRTSEYYDVTGRVIPKAEVDSVFAAFKADNISPEQAHQFILKHPKGFEGTRGMLAQFYEAGAAKGHYVGRPRNITYMDTIQAEAQAAPTQVARTRVAPRQQDVPTQVVPQPQAVPQPVATPGKGSFVEDAKKWVKDNPYYTAAGVGAAGLGAGLLLGGDTNVTVKGASMRRAQNKIAAAPPVTANPLFEAGKDLANVLYREYPGIERGHQYLKQIKADGKLTSGTAFGLGANALKTIGFTSLVGVGGKKLLAKPEPQIIYVHPDGSKEVVTGGAKKTAGVFLAPSQLDNSSPSALIADLERRMTPSGGNFKQAASSGHVKQAFTMSPTVRNALIGATGSAAVLAATLRLKEQSPVPPPYDPAAGGGAFHDARRLYRNMSYDMERYARAHPTASLVGAALAGAGAGALSRSIAWQNLKDTMGP